MAVTVPFTRAGLGGYTDVNGIYLTAPVDTLRIDYSGPPHTNQCLWSRDLTNAAWILNGADAGLVAQNEVGLDGVTINTATTLTDNTAAFFVGRSQVFTVPNDSNTHIVGVWIKKDNDTSRFPEVAMSLSGGVAQNNKAQINTRTGATALRASTGTHPFGSTDAGLWWIFWVSVINNGTGNTVLTLDIYPARTSIIGSANVAAIGSIIIGNVEVEFNTGLITGAITTTNAIVTANADSVALYEPVAGQNLCLQTEALIAPWILTGGSITANSTTAPNGIAASAGKLIEDASNGNHFLRQVIICPSVQQTFSVFVKAAERTKCVLAISDGIAGNANIGIDLTNGLTFTGTGFAIGAWTNQSVMVDKLANGWYRVFLTATRNAGVGSTVNVYAWTTSLSYVGVVGNGIFVWGSDFKLDTGTSYFPSVAAAQTRAADIDSMLSAVAGGYSRQNGNFITEGFTPGMSIATTGFSFTPPSSVITKVSATSIAQSGQRIPEAVAPGRSLTGTVVARGSGIYGTSQSTIDLSAFPEDRTGVTNA